MTPVDLQGHVYLIGFMGCGKSAMGRLLAPRLGRPFLDLDETIESRQEMPISEIFAQRGEAFFRQLETELLQELANHPPSVVAPGGGAYASESNRRLMRQSGVAVWLDVPLELALRRALKDPERPLAASREQFQQLYRRRREVYALADVTVEVGNDPKSETCERIFRALQGQR